MLPAALLAFVLIASPEKKYEPPAEIIDHLDAIKSVEECRKSAVDGVCRGVWKGLEYTSYSGYSGSLNVLGKAGQKVKWSYQCRFDKVESFHSCSLTQRDVSVVTIRGFVDLVTWGGEAYPGSEKIVRFEGSSSPLRFPDKLLLTGKNADLMVGLMKMAPSATFRWFNWPYNAPQDSDVDLTQFGDVLNLFTAMEFRYRIENGG